MANLSELISVAEAASILGISYRSVHRLISAGTLPAHKLSGKTGSYVISREDVGSLAAQRSAA